MISVIIPVYNTEKYLRSCLDSLLAQTYTDLEIIFVDDGSTDGSAQILDEFQAMDNRIRVIHQKNGGVSSARNRGIEEATGEYLSFIDSDDTLEPDMYEVLMALIREHGVDIAHCSYNRVTDGIVKPIGNSGALHLHSSEQALECLLTGNLFVGSCWTKLYARKLFASVRFPTGIRTSEDMLVNFLLFRQVEKSAFLDVCKYNYLTSETSSCIRAPQRKRAEDLLAVNRKMLEENTEPKIEPILQRRILGALFSCYKAAKFEKQGDREFQRELQTQISEMKKRGFRFTKRTAMEYFLLRHMPVLYKLIFAIYDRIRVPNYDV